MPSTASQRFQVKISGQWNDYAPKEDDVLKAAFEAFVVKMNEGTLSSQESCKFKELVIKGRRYVVDFHKMIQVRKDNKKDYKVRPPAGSPVRDGNHAGPTEQGHLSLKCEQCHQPYLLRPFNCRSDDDSDWADCRCCQVCWRPWLAVEEKKTEKNQKQRQVVQPCHVSTSNLEKSSSLRLLHTEEQQNTQTVMHCAYCGQAFENDQVVFLGGACDKRCELCHDDCGKKQHPDRIAMAKQYSVEHPNSQIDCPSYAKKTLSLIDWHSGSDLKRIIQETYKKTRAS